MLFNPLQVGSLTLPNRILLAPLTRTRADAGHMPNALMAEYYSQRATGGLLISECTMVAPGTSAFVNEPGIYNDAQIAAWRQVTDAQPTLALPMAPPLSPAAPPLLRVRSTRPKARCRTRCPAP